VPDEQTEDVEGAPADPDTDSVEDDRRASGG
jgi:hypothetical protein